MNREAVFGRGCKHPYDGGVNRRILSDDPFIGLADPLQVIGLFQVIADNINAVFWARDLRADKLLYINQAYEKIWGRSRLELFQHNYSWQDAVHSDDLAMVRAEHAGSGGEKKSVEYRIVRGDGEIRWVRSQTFMLDDEQGGTHEVGIAEDVTDFRLMLDHQRETEQRFRRMLEEEQKRIARDLHDQFGQLLPLLRQRIERLCRQQAGTRAGECSGRLRESAENSALDRALVDRLLDSMGGIIRQTINRLRPECLEDLGFLPGIEFKVNEFARGYPGIKTSFAVVGRSRPIGRKQEEEFYWVLQEALVNIARHAEADQATVRLIFAYPEVILEVRDNGRGFDREVLGRGPTSWGGLGLRGMGERMAGIGGDLRIIPEVGRGTLIRAKLFVGGK